MVKQSMVCIFQKVVYWWSQHLGGQGSVKRYFKNGKVFKDDLWNKNNIVYETI